MAGNGVPDVPDPHSLSRFLHAQEAACGDALAEIRRGRKRSHWMWFVFPQFYGLGAGGTSKHYAIRSLEEARAYLPHPVLGPRLVECAEAALAAEARSAHDIFGSPDDLKLRSCATLFARASPAGSVFHRLLERYFAGRTDERTLALLGRVPSATARVTSRTRISASSGRAPRRRTRGVIGAFAPDPRRRCGGSTRLVCAQAASPTVRPACGRIITAVTSLRF